VRMYDIVWTQSVARVREKQRAADAMAVMDGWKASAAAAEGALGGELVDDAPGVSDINRESVSGVGHGVCS
jgi:hypothetical protein